LEKLSQRYWRLHLLSEKTCLYRQSQSSYISVLLLMGRFTSIDGQDTSQPLPYDPKASISEQVTSSFHRSLQNLQVDYIDSVVLHSPLRTREVSKPPHTVSKLTGTQKTLEAYRTLEGFANQGQVRNLGVSNIYDRSELEWLISQARVPVKVVQNRWYEGNGWDWDGESHSPQSS
jgi:hypothetical protein